ncbi:hypothetical protein BST61_g1781 [Cercospora zeina]
MLSKTFDEIHADDDLPCPFEAVLAGLKEDLTTTITESGKQYHDDLDYTLMQLKNDLLRAYQDTTTLRSYEEARAHKQLKSLLNHNQHELDCLKADLSILKQKYNMPFDELQQAST